MLTESAPSSLGLFPFGQPRITSHKAVILPHLCRCLGMDKLFLLLDVTNVVLRGHDLQSQNDLSIDRRQVDDRQVLTIIPCLGLYVGHKCDDADYQL